MLAVVRGNDQQAQRAWGLVVSPPREQNRQESVPPWPVRPDRSLDRRSDVLVSRGG
jgi:hypothetical protein